METFIGVTIIFGVPALIAWLVMRRRPGPERVCTRCGHHGKTVSKTPGSTGIELILWIFLLVPGLIYGLWRINNRRQVCASCGSTELVPPQSPAGRKLIGEHSVK